MCSVCLIEVKCVVVVVVVVVVHPQQKQSICYFVLAPPGPPTDVKARAVSHEINLQWEGPATPTPLHYIVKWGTKLALLDMVGLCECVSMLQVVFFVLICAFINPLPSSYRQWRSTKAFTTPLQAYM